MGEQFIARAMAVQGLQDWWYHHLSVSDRKAIQENYAFNQSSGDDFIAKCKDFQIAFLTKIAAKLNHETTRHTAYRCIIKAGEVWPDDAPAIECHNAVTRISRIFYSWRHLDSFASRAAILACEKSLAISAEVAAWFRAQEEYQKTVQFPSHYCLTQLCTLEEERGEYQRIIDICKIAKRDGWAGDWDQRIARAQMKSSVPPVIH